MQVLSRIVNNFITTVLMFPETSRTIHIQNITTNNTEKNSVTEITKAKPEMQESFLYKQLFSPHHLTNRGLLKKSTLTSGMHFRFDQ